MLWNPEQYSRFERERLAPALDLLQSVPIMRIGLVADLGCGTGVILPYIRDRSPEARIIALDHDAQMLQVARSQAYADHYVQCRIEDWLPDEKLDLIFSNAAFHWLPDQKAAIDRCLSFLNPGGVLAVQIPDNWGEPSHHNLYTLARSERWQKVLEQNIFQPSRHDSQDYYRWCKDCSASVRVWETRYLHYFEEAQDIVEWMKGTSLGQILALLGPEDQKVFLGEYTGLIVRDYPPMAEGQVAFPFRRIFLCAIKK